MMINLLNIEEWAERYANEDLSSLELKELHEVLNKDHNLNKAFEESLKIQVLLKDYKKKSEFKSLLTQVANKHKATTRPIVQAATKVEHTIPQTKDNKTLALLWIRKNWKTVSAAAAIAVFSSLSTYSLIKTTNNQGNNSQYVLLKRDMETLKKSQNKIISDIKNVESNNEEAANPAIYGGSAFAVSDNGYFSTNYHVVEKADSVFIQTKDGINHKATIVKVNPEADLAILKIEADDFKFPTKIPYSIDKNVGKLGQKIFSIGFPKDDVVYNEGYISADKGYEDNALSYQLEITANPGQSGAPIFDNKGNIIGIITGKQLNTTGTTYAVHAEQLLQLLNELPKSERTILSNKNRYKNLERTEQVGLLQDFVCPVKVY
ncbi:MAG TPA: serine protease [Edaphocola sp.]|nr:serine protease [Edaphocola sp.]